MNIRWNLVRAWGITGVIIMVLGFAATELMLPIMLPIITSPYGGGATPRFHARQCFVFQGERESWETPIDGQILIVGKTKYLWEPWASVQPNHGKKPWRMGREYGISSEIQTFDTTTQLVDCQWEKE